MPEKPQKSVTKSDPTRQVTTQLVAVEESFEGPIPPAAVLAQYEAVVPGSAATIMSWAAAEQAHRHAIDRSELDAARVELMNRYKERRLGQWLGFGVVLVMCSCAAWMVSTGHEIAGSAFALTGVVQLVSLFIFGQKAASSPSKSPPPDKDGPANSP